MTARRPRDRAARQQLLCQRYELWLGTTYSGGSGTIGDHTDIGNWYDWFRGPNNATYLARLYNESRADIRLFASQYGSGGQKTK